MSKSPVDEALVRLREQNLVERKPRSGCRVRPISLSQVNEMYDIRTTYETCCLSRRSNITTKPLWSELAGLASITGIGPATDWASLNVQFHEAPTRVCGNKRFARSPQILLRFTPISLTRMAEPQILESLAAEHVVIVAAIRDRNKRSANRAVTRYIEASHRPTVEAVIPSCLLAKAILA
jgi:DNA-binding GntR family transcriptional regulator